MLNLALLCFVCACTNALPPHIFYFLVDDWGHADASWHAPYTNLTEVVTPNIHALVSEGVELDRFYAHRYCSPTRSALQTGRNPIHVNVLNSNLGEFNLADPVGGYEGIARNFTGIASLLKTAGYKTAAVGKWFVSIIKKSKKTACAARANNLSLPAP
jgi:arylsulfatase B